METAVKADTLNIGDRIHSGNGIVVITFVTLVRGMYIEITFRKDGLAGRTGREQKLTLRKNAYVTKID